MLTQELDRNVAKMGRMPHEKVAPPFFTFGNEAVEIRNNCVDAWRERGRFVG
jgi:hypothetical protein